MPAKPTLLHVCECYVGGVRTHLDTLLPALVKYGFDVGACLSVQRDACAAEHAERLRAQGVHVTLWSGRRGFDLRGDRAAQTLLRSRLSSRPAQIIHSHGAKAGFLVRTLDCMRNVVRVHSPHGFAHAKAREFGALKRGVFRAIERRLRHATQQLVAVSQAEAALARALGYHEAQLSVIPNGVELPAPGELCTPAAARTRLGLQQDGPLALLAGILMPEKGHALILRALAHPAAASWRVLVVGDGSERERLQTLASRLGLQERVRFVGVVKNLDLWIDACDLALLPSHSEGLPYVALEVLARGRLLLSSGVGGLNEIYDGAAHAAAAAAGLELIIEGAREAEWAEALRAWQHASAARETCAAHGPRIVAERFSARAQADAHAELYLRSYERTRPSSGSAE